MKIADVLGLLAVGWILYIAYQVFYGTPKPGSVAANLQASLSPREPGVATQSVPSVAKDWFFGSPGVMDALEDNGPRGIKGQR